MIRPLTPHDQPALEMFLSRHLSSSMFLLNNVRHSGIVEGGERFQGTYVAAFQGAEIVGAAAHYWNGNLMPQAGADVALAPELARAVLRASGRALKGVVGERENCMSLIRALGIEHSRYRVFESEGLYTLPIRSMRIPVLAAQVRRAKREDSEALIRFYRDYNIEALNESDEAAALADAITLVENRMQSQTQFVLEQGGEIVAASSFNATVDSFAQIGGVWTSHQHRSQGYARACVAGSLMIAARDGFTDAILFTGDDNIPAIRCYSVLGFSRIGDFFIGILSEPVHFKNSNAAP